MKPFFLLFALFGTLAVSAQRLTDQSQVKDSAGSVYPAAIWRSLLSTGSYTLRAENAKDPNTAFILIRLTEEEKNSRFAKMPMPRESPNFRKGEKFNLGKVSDIAGNKIDLKNNTGRITVVNFWFINCAPCRKEIPDLNKLVDKYSSDSVRFVAVALDGKYELEEFLKQMPFRYAVVDDGRNLAQRYEIRSYPTHVVVDPEGKVYFHTTGLAPNTVYWIEKSINELKNKTTAPLTAGTD